MSQFLTSPEAVLSPECVLLNTFTYIIDELTDVASDSAKLGIPTSYVTDDGEELIGKLVENSNHRLRMYGSARELTENVKIFRNTPGSRRFDDAHGSRLYPYYTTPVIYKSLKGEEYICKPDAYLILQNMTLEAYPFEKPQVLRSLIAIFLRSQEIENLKNLEFVKFDREVFDEIKEEIRENMSHFMTDPSEFYPLMLELSQCEFPQLLEKFKNQIPIEWRDSDGRFFEKVLARYVRDFCDAPNFVNLLTILFNTTGEIVKILKRVIDGKVEIFKNYSNPITVRLFEDGSDEQFVMKAELFHAINQVSTKKITYKEKHEECIETISLTKAQKEFGVEIQNIEFIRCPIIRAKHRAVPITMPLETEYCILAIDAFFETMKTLIVGAKFFQKLSMLGWNTVALIFKVFESAFKPDEKNPYFITQNSLNIVKNKFLDEFSFFPAKDVRNAKKDGFTVQNLKNELAHLNLTEMNPEIQNYAEDVYSEVVKNKKEEFLRTCDLFDAVEHCQLNCAIRRLPNLKKFLHNQKGCSRVYGYKCEECDKIQKTSELQKEAPETKNPTEKTSEITPDVKKKPEAQILKTSTSEPPKAPESISIPQKMVQVTAETKPSSSTAPKASESKNLIQKASNNDSNAPGARNQKTSDLKAPDSKTPSESQNQKTSSNCEKCHRVCEMLNETKKELKSTENKLKNLEKKERKIDEFEKNRMENLELEIQKLKAEIKEKDETMAKIKDEKLRQEESQKVLEERNSKLENELEEEKMKAFEIQKTSQAEILEKNKKLEEFKESEIKMKTESEMNRKMIQQLLDKLGGGGASYSNPTSSRIKKNSSSTSSRNQQICEICWNPTDNSQSVKCQKCRHPFHSTCASNWLKSYKMCPSCEGKFQ